MTKKQKLWCFWK